MEPKAFTRREILKMGSLTAASAFAIAMTGVTVPANSWAMTVSALSEAQANTLLSICRSIYPHPKIGDLFYAASVESLDQQAAQNPDTHSLLASGLDDINQRSNGQWSTLSEIDKSAILTAISSTPFFQTVRGNMVVSLYDNPKIWPLFGYEGPSFAQGGYLHRGFDDINWLPDAEKE
ncbi:hypothetical protein L4D06_05505 [Enterovibrio makurazakiensis]|uniref:Twin-arginine translocation pathway signal n=1 Tax=Enterovibrio gelatinilyticus TaxID=2899819 RepID=A0ABT5R0F1_9GAMM|nr:hypothetical protein [Enterovibrio sp. ZSDZ42]MDD1793226.1 hypothetical protein [Enterovibrio sp. ZSDZ42]